MYYVCLDGLAGAGRQLNQRRNQFDETILSSPQIFAINALRDFLRNRGAEHRLHAAITRA
jgi:hypothetical protein